MYLLLALIISHYIIPLNHSAQHTDIRHDEK